MHNRLTITEVEEKSSPDDDEVGWMVMIVLIFF